MTVPDWALTLAFWIHMAATVVWIGALAALSFLVIPSARQSLPPLEYARLLEQVQRRLDPLGWFSLALLTVTGLVQMSGNPNYRGLLSVENRWALAILIKHLVFLGMIGVSAFVTWWVLPGLRRAGLRAELEGSDDSAALSRSQELTLLRLNLGLSLIVLALTAIARTA